MLDDRRIELSETRLKKAHREHQAAYISKNAGLFDAANNRAYYAMFHAIRAVLALDDIDFKKHSQTLGYFNRNYVNANLVDKSLNEMVRRASKCRNGSDYEDYYVATKDEAELNVLNASMFLTTVEQYIAARVKGEHIQSSMDAEDDEYEDDDLER